MGWIWIRFIKFVAGTGSGISNSCSTDKLKKLCKHVSGDYSIDLILLAFFQCSGSGFRGLLAPD